MRDNEALDTILTIEELIEKCTEAENISRPERSNNLSRLFVDTDKIEQFFVKKAIRTAADIKIRYFAIKNHLRNLLFSRVTMATNYNNKLVVSYVTCDCPNCITGKYKLFFFQFMVTLRQLSIL